MPQTQRPLPRTPLGSLIAIAAVVGGTAVAFAYTAGWLSPQRRTPARLVAGFGTPAPADLGHQRNYAKGVCFTGRCDANGAGTTLSRAAVFTTGSYPVVGRFNLGTLNPAAKDASVRVRGLSIQVKPSGGQEWRSGMIDAPFFLVATPQASYALLTASGSKDPDAMGAFIAAHPEFKPFGAWAKTGPWTGSYAEERYNGLNAVRFIDASDTAHAVRWTMQVTVADAADPTADPSRPWPADRRRVDVGTPVVSQVQPERDGPCRDVNYDPTVLPDGIAASDDPFPAARSAAYAVSYHRRTAEAADDPRTASNPAEAAQP